MKTIILTLGLCLCAFALHAENSRTAVAGENACALYDALALAAGLDGLPGAIVIEGDMPTTTYRKAISGLTCRLMQDKRLSQGEICNCSFEEDLSVEQMADIYSKLTSREAFIGGTDVKVFNKTVGTMFFTKKIYELNVDESITNYQFSVFYN